MKESGTLFRYETLLYALAALVYYGFFAVQKEYLLDSDLYFHIKIASLISEHGWVTRLPWMSLSIHSERYVDYHFLFHYLLVPFVWVSSDLIVAAKLATVTMAAFTVGMLVHLLKRLGANHRWFWVILFLISSPIFTGRFMFGRASVLFIGVLYLFMLFLKEERNKPLFLISFLAVWTYPGFLLFPLFSGIYFLAGGLLEGTWRVRSVLIVLGGILTGFLIHPSFPYQIQGYWLELIVHSLRPPGLEKIAEWDPPSMEILIVGSLFPLLLYGTGLLMHRRADPFHRSLMLFVVVVLFSIVGATKPFEYLVPIIIPTLALTDWENLSLKGRKAATTLYLVVLSIWSLPQTFHRINQQYEMLNPEYKFDAALWVRNNVPENEVVMLPWSNFPEFFFKDHSHRFLFGLNPVYAYGFDSEKYRAVSAFFSGKAVNFYEIPGYLGYEYAVLSRLENRYVLSVLESDSHGAQKLYENKQYVIYKFSPAVQKSGKPPFPPAGLRTVPAPSRR